MVTNEKRYWTIKAKHKTVLDRNKGNNKILGEAGENSAFAFQPKEAYEGRFFIISSDFCSRLQLLLTTNLAVLISIL